MSSLRKQNFPGAKFQDLSLDPDLKMAFVLILFSLIQDLVMHGKDFIHQSHSIFFLLSFYKTHSFSKDKRGLQNIFISKKLYTSINQNEKKIVLSFPRAILSSQQ